MKTVQIILIMAFFFQNYSGQAIPRPLLSWGISSKATIKEYHHTSIPYPSYLSELFYLSIQQKFSTAISLSGKANFSCSRYNKAVSDPFLSHRFSGGGDIKLKIQPAKKHSISLYTAPKYTFASNKHSMRMQNRITWTFKNSLSRFQLGYSHLFSLPGSGGMDHKFFLYIYWKHKKTESCKFKFSGTVWLQHPLNGQKSCYPLKSISLKFSMALDWNKVDFITIFDTDSRENFYEEED